MRRFLIALATLVVVFLVVDYAARDYAEGRLANELEASFELKERPEVSIGGWPFIMKVWSGELTSISAEADTVRKDDLVLEQLEIEVRDIKVSLEDLLNASAGGVRIGSGRGSARLTSDALTKALRAGGLPATVSIEDGRVVVKPDQGPEAQGSIRVQGRRLIVSAPGLDEVSIALPAPIEGLRYTEVEIEGSSAVLRFELTRANLDLTSDE